MQPARDHPPPCQMAPSAAFKRGGANAAWLLAFLILPSLSLVASAAPSVAVTVASFQANQAYEATDYEKALQLTRQWLRLAQRSNDTTETAAALGSLGACQARLNQPDSARASLSEAMRLSIAIGDSSGVATWSASISAVEIQARKYPEAALALRRGLTALAANSHRRERSILLNNLGAVFEATGLVDSSLATYGRALAESRAAMSSTSEHIVLANIGHLLLVAQHFEAASAYYDSADVRVSADRRTFPTDRERITFATSHANMYEEWISCWMHLIRAGHVSLSDGMYAALAISERGRMRTLLDMTEPPRMPPWDFAARDSTGRLSAEGLQCARAFRKSGCLGIYYQPVTDTLLLWVLGPGHMDRFLIEGVPRTLVERMAPFLIASIDSGVVPDAARMIEKTGRYGIRELWSEYSLIALPDTIVKLVRGCRTDVVLFPEGWLHQVPFSALRLGNHGPRLGTAAAIRYGTTLGRMAKYRLADDRRPIKSLDLRPALVCGDPPPPPLYPRTPRLPAARASARFVAGLLGTRALVDSNATIAAVVAALPSARVVYLTLHGLPSSDALQPAQVSVALAPSAGSSGFLSATDILGMPTDLSASLIVIAACRSALGPIRPTEGVIGLQRALLARGSKAVIAGQWDLYEQPTAQLLNGFFRHWLRDPDRPTKAESLRRATAEIVRNPSWEQPRYWAGMKLMN